MMTSARGWWWVYFLFHLLAASGDTALPHGTFAVVSGHKIIFQPYPSGQRAAVARMDSDKQYQCTQCDPGAPTEQCFPELSVCAKLSDTDVTIFGTDGVWHSSTRFDVRCSPRGLQKLAHMGLHLSIDCSGFSSQVASITGTTVSVYDTGGRNVQKEIVVEGAGGSGMTEVYRVEIYHDLLYQSNFHAGHSLDITPWNVHCAFTSLFPLYTRDKFLLWCDTHAGEHLYVIDVNHDFPETIPHIVSNGPPLSSPNGQTFVTVANSTLKAYRTDNLNTQPPGARDFGSVILFHTYIDNNTLLLHVEGESQIIVDVAMFIGSSGSEGVISLPSASINATLQKATHSGVYVTCNKTDTLFNLLLFNTSNGELIDTFPNFVEKPLNVFFQKGFSHISTEVPLHSPILSTKPVVQVTSRETVLLQTPTSPTVPVRPTSRTKSNVPIFVTVAVTFLVVVAILLFFILIIRRSKVASKLSCRYSSGPFTQATQATEDNSSEVV